ncbi:YqkE family protein [Aquibacillus sediminis]|uniref:YqkE family protein n=1 Tax=Aquibacillus sediminis TaxID=2574734 RepID=UPI0011095B7D|nr:YqkE family protein [Aquibacillus sediminis]
MKKRKNEEQANGLKDRLNPELLSALQNKKTTLKQQEEDKKEQERLQRIEERKRKEANKSFEELLEESEMDWRKFK